MSSGRMRRLLRLRQHDEREERAARAAAVRALEALERERTELLDLRRREEAAIAEASRSDAETLRRQHAHLMGLELLLRELGGRIRKAQEELAEREESWREARRSVKSLEMVLARQAARAARLELYEQQKLADALSARRRAGSQGEGA